MKRWGAAFWQMHLRAPHAYSLYAGLLMLMCYACAKQFPCPGFMCPWRAHPLELRSSLLIWWNTAAHQLFLMWHGNIQWPSWRKPLSILFLQGCFCQKWQHVRPRCSSSCVQFNTSCKSVRRYTRVFVVWEKAGAPLGIRLKAIAQWLSMLN